ncbi:MAG: hypothetical protein V4648_03465 [Bacteroidota bacterium]
MKATLFFLVYLMSFGFVYSQEINCVEKQKEFSQLVKDGKYKQAVEPLSLLRKKCPSQSEDLYLFGITTLKNEVDVAAADKKEVAIRDLIKLYDQYDANFPNNKNGNLVNKAMLLYDNNKGSDAEIYAFLNKAFTSNPDQFTTANSLFIYFKLYNDNYTSKKENISLEQLLEKYNDVLIAIEKNKVLHPEKAVEFNNASKSCKSLVAPLLVPENLIAMAEKKFDANMQNTEWLETTANLLSEKCAATPIFGKIATQLHQLKPSSQSAYHLGNYNVKNRNQKVAIPYFEQAATLTTNRFEKAKIYYTVATILSASDKEQARKMIASAIENNPKKGSYYILLANIYANSATECGASPLQQKAIYQLANLTVQKAGQVEPKLKTTADQLAKEYTKNSPTKEEFDEIKKAGGAIKVGCWINETVPF